jgi:hypothetical protein
MRRRLLRSVLNCIICIILDRSVVQSPNRSCPLLMESPCTLYPSSKPPLPYLDLSWPIREGLCSSLRGVHQEIAFIGCSILNGGFGGSDFMQLGRSKTTIIGMPQTSNLHAIIPTS